MDLLIVSGMSGSGKSSVLTILEDMGFYCIDNFPINLYKTLPSLISDEKVDYKLAITLDVRNRQSFNLIEEMFEYLKNNKVNYSLMFIDAENDALLIRYKETRRAHPLMRGHDKTLEFAIEEERSLLRDIRGSADYLINTSELLIVDLRKTIHELFGEISSGDFVINFVSFGFKYGILADADLIFDLRCLTNPYYEKELRYKTGNDQEVFDYVMASKDAQILYKHILEYLKFSAPLYVREGKSQLVVGLGCTGGKHRSVTFANKLNAEFSLENTRNVVRHRDIKK